jgi:hydroxypyruvate reductase
MTIAEDYKERIELLAKIVINAADPGRLLKNHLTLTENKLDIEGKAYSPSAVFLVSVGKAAVSMAQTAAEQLDGLIKVGIVIAKASAAPSLPTNLTYYQAAHPIPDQRSVDAASAVKTLLSQTTKDDLVLCLISGGTSALLTRPILPLANWQRLNQALLASGCTINDINTVRQLFDEVKGGGLAHWAAPAASVSFILSDVIGSQLEYIGSGPTVPVEKDPRAVRVILDKYNVWNWLDSYTKKLVQDYLNSPTLLSPANLKNNHHIIIGDVSTATAAAARKTAEWGYESIIVSNTLTGEAAEIGQMAAQIAAEMPPNTARIWGGESTVTIRGNGKGGRNQEIALAAAIALENGPDCLIAAFSTDAEDGPMPVAGAFVTNETAVLAKSKGLDPVQFLAINDSYTFFKQLGQGHITAETGTNVNDLLIILMPGEVI